MIAHIFDSTKISYTGHFGRHGLKPNVKASGSTNKPYIHIYEVLYMYTYARSTKISRSGHFVWKVKSDIIQCIHLCFCMLAFVNCVIISCEL